MMVAMTLAATLIRVFNLVELENPNQTERIVGYIVVILVCYFVFNYACGWSYVMEHTHIVIHIRTCTHTHNTTHTHTYAQTHFAYITQFHDPFVLQRDHIRSDQ